MKSPAEVVADVTARMSRTWASTLVHEQVNGNVGTGTWPHQFPLGLPRDGHDLYATWGQVHRLAATWRDFAATKQLALVSAPRRVGGTLQRLPTHLVVDDIDVAARLAGPVWTARLSRGRRRAQALTSRFPLLEQPASVLSAVDSYSGVDFELACATGEWFAGNDCAGLTARQIPVVGLHAKWLDGHARIVRTLAGLDSLTLTERPSYLHFTYLDPAYLATGARRHDSATPGDRVPLPYVPRVVLISENKDTAVFFPPVPDAVAVQGAGAGGSTCAAFDWLTQAQHLLYWGDMDADGLEILNEFRMAGVPARSFLMDVPTYDTWQRFGTNFGRTGTPLTPRAPRRLTHLTGPEIALYERLISPEWTGFRRVEQERIPLDFAHQTLHHQLR